MAEGSILPGSPGAQLQSVHMTRTQKIYPITANEMEGIPVVRQAHGSV